MESEDSDNLMTMFKGTDEGLEEKEEEEAESGLPYLAGELVPGGHFLDLHGAVSCCGC